MNTSYPVPGEYEPFDDIDRQVLSELAQVYTQVDPPPAGMTDRVIFNLTLAGLHAEIAELQQGEPALTRADQSVESMTFSGSRSSLMVTVTPTVDPEAPVRIDGWVTRGGTTVELVTADAVLARVADDRGRLAWEFIPRGVIHFVIRADDPSEPSTITPRVEL